MDEENQGTGTGTGGDQTTFDEMTALQQAPQGMDNDAQVDAPVDGSADTGSSDPALFQTGADENTFQAVAGATAAGTESGDADIGTTGGSTTGTVGESEARRTDSDSQGVPNSGSLALGEDADLVVPTSTRVDPDEGTQAAAADEQAPAAVEEGDAANADPATVFPSEIVTPPPNATITLDDVTVAEDGSVTFTARVDVPPASDLVITLSNGVTIVIPAGSLVGTSDPIAVGGEDPYVDPQSLPVSIASATGGGFAAIDTSTPPATVTVTDTVTPATVSLGDVTVDEGGNATITATLDFPVTGSPLVITLSNGATITIPVGATSGTSTPFSPPNGEDPYNDPGSSTLTINGTTGGNFEALDTADTATVTVNDTVNATTVTLGDVAVDEGGNVTVTATLSNPVTGSPLVITLSNGATITIPVGATSGTSTPFAPGNTEDPYNDPSFRCFDQWHLGR